MLALIDLSAAFDSVDQRILLRRLESHMVVLQWFVCRIWTTVPTLSAAETASRPLRWLLRRPTGVRSWTPSVSVIHC